MLIKSRLDYLDIRNILKYALFSETKKKVAIILTKYIMCTLDSIVLLSLNEKTKVKAIL